MKRKLLSIISIGMLAAVITSCNESNDITPNVLGDVYVKVKTISDKTQYALYGYAYSNVALKSASIKTPVDDAEVITLNAIENQTNVFTNYTSTDALYSEVIPAAGDYAFTIKTNDDIDFNVTDNLKDELASIPVITKSIVEDSKISIEWTETANVDAYIIRFLDVDNKEIFTTNYITKTTLTLSISDETAGWLDTKSIDNAVKVKLMGVKFENSTSPGRYNLQSISEGFKDIEK